MIDVRLWFVWRYLTCFMIIGEIVDWDDICKIIGIWSYEKKTKYKQNEQNVKKSNLCAQKSKLQTRCKALVAKKKLRKF